MSTLYIINNTAGTGVFTIFPGGLNGPGGSAPDNIPGQPITTSDLRLYGVGTIQYGEGVNEDLFRITENFACPEKVLNDFLPGTDNPNGFVPGAGTYDPAINPVLPKDKYDLGAGNGINNSVNGQSWFNTSRNKLMTFVDGVGFQFAGAPSSGSTAPASPTTGDIWYDTTIPQLKVYNGTSFLSSADRYVQIDGVIPMTGNLTITGSASPGMFLQPTTTGGWPQIVLNDVSGNVRGIFRTNFTNDLQMITKDVAGLMLGGFGVSGTDGTPYTTQPQSTGVNSLTRRDYVDTTTVALDGTRQMTGNLTIGGSASPLLSLQPTTGTGNPQVDFLDSTGTTRGIVYIDPNNGNLLLSARTGSTIHGEFWLSGVDGAPYTTQPQSTGANSLARRDYVDAEIALVNGTATSSPKIYTSLSGSAKSGDIAVVSGIIYIANAPGTWKQIFPAIYN